MRKSMWVFGLALVFFAGSAGAQSPTSHPGYFPVEELGIFDSGQLEVDVNLEGAMLNLVAGAMEEEGEDQDLARMVTDLERIRVLVGTVGDIDPETVAMRIDDAASRLEAGGWNRVVRVEEDDEKVYLFAREQDGSIVGLTVLVSDDGEEAVAVNIVGTIDPATLGRIVSGMDEIPDLEKYVEVVE